LKTELTDGVRAGDIRLEKAVTELMARCVIEVTWIPENIVRESGERAAFVLARDTVLRGIAKR
jgi:hypothetical protein